MTNTFSIKINRLFLAVIITFLVADTYPHPQLSPGLVETMGSRVQLALHEFLPE